MHPIRLVKKDSTMPPLNNTLAWVRHELAKPSNCHATDQSGVHTATPSPTNIVTAPNPSTFGNRFAICLMQDTTGRHPLKAFVQCAQLT